MDDAQDADAHRAWNNACCSLGGVVVVLPTLWLMSRTVANCTFANDVVRIDNAMALYGFELEREEGGIRYYRAKGFFRRLTFFFEDRVEVREAEGVVVIEGIRRAVARIAFQLEAYIHNSRFEDKE